MLLSDLDLNNLSRLLSQQVDHVTCMECCKYYTVPTTASCGHTLCHSCWRGRQTCAACGKQFEKKNLKLNIPLQNLSKHVLILSHTFEDLFNIKLDEFLLDSPIEIIPEPNKNVKEWLASSQNQFSAPVTNSTQSTQDHIQTEQITSDIQIHTENTRSSNLREVVHFPHQQDDWDKIEEMPDAEKNTNTNQNNVVGPMDIEPFEFMGDEDEEYTTSNPRRSSRQKENKTSHPSINHDKSPQENSEDLNTNSEKRKVEKVTKSWNNVKKMKKEFSKLYKQNRNKLNVSIEMCKKNQNSNKAINSIPPEKLFIINDNTPEIIANAEHDISNNKITEETENVNEHEHASMSVNENTSRNAVNIINETCQNIHNKVTEVPKVSFIKKSTLQSKSLVITNNKRIEANEPSTDNTVNNDDIEITIKIGNTLANICIKKKNNDVQFKINSDREVQTSLENCSFNKRHMSSTIIDVNNLEHNHNSERNANTLSAPKATVTNRSLSNKNTASADTTTAQFEITESIEREMTKSLDFNELNGKETDNKNSIHPKILEVNRSASQRSLRILNKIPEDMDLDIFDGESEKVGNVTSLKSTKNTPSAILPSIQTTKPRTSLTNDKRDRDLDDVYDSFPSSKKIKLTRHKADTTITDKSQKDLTTDNDNVNDEVMGKVVINNNSYKEKNINKINNIKEINPSQTNHSIKNMSQIIEKNTSQSSFTNHSRCGKTLNPTSDVKCSENIFSILDNDSEILKTFDYKTQTHTQHHTTSKSKTTTDLDVMELCTPVQDDDSDKSVVEDTPQKSASFSKKKNKNETTITNNTDNNITIKPNLNTKQSQKIQENTDSEDINVISLSDTLGDSTEKIKNVTVSQIEPRITLETPVTITKFVDQIKHKSTPVARKSLNFNNDNCDAEITICPSSFVLAQTTQEREFLSKAFEHTLGSEKCLRKNVKFCLAGSCLNAAEQSKVKYLCSEKKWTYIEKYTKDLTHLIVGVDEENKSQRSVKYMCALAAGKWIISYEWTEKCLETGDIVDEEPFEALDCTGEPGPRRSRLSKRKLFTGISFYCMPPFSVLDVETLKYMLVCSGGRVLVEAREAGALERPALVLAEPEHTEEDRFIYLAMQLSVVPINYEWVLNCLGSYSLDPIYDLLLFPASLLPPVVAKWPTELISRDDE